ncbi:hypothetical protein ZWY2020_003223 [Hordeum vulgare]|nr:hypothetical protein ZWY2020_003223 [Hordeum vulgare]
MQTISSFPPVCRCLGAWRRLGTALTDTYGATLPPHLSYGKAARGQPSHPNPSTPCFGEIRGSAPVAAQQSAPTCGALACVPALRPGWRPPPRSGQRSADEDSHRHAQPRPSPALRDQPLTTSPPARRQVGRPQRPATEPRSAFSARNARSASSAGHARRRTGAVQARCSARTPCSKPPCSPGWEDIEQERPGSDLTFSRSAPLLTVNYLCLWHFS